MLLVDNDDTNQVFNLPYNQLIIRNEDLLRYAIITRLL